MHYTVTLHSDKGPGSGSSVLTKLRVVCVLSRCHGCHDMGLVSLPRQQQGVLRESNIHAGAFCQWGWICAPWNQDVPCIMCYVR